MARTLLLFAAASIMLAERGNAQIICDHAFTIGGGYADLGNAVADDAAGNIYCTGTFQYIADIDPGGPVQNLISVGLDDAYLIKYAPTGNLLWGLNIGSTTNDNGRDVAVDANDNVYVTGIFTGTADFDPSSGTHTLVSVGASDVFVAKYDPNGNYVWAVSIGGAASESATGLVIDDAAGNVILCGGYSSPSIDLDPGAGTQNFNNAGISGYDILVCVLDVNGAFQTGFAFGGVDGEQANAVTTDGSGDLIVVGDLGSVDVDFDPGVGSSLLSDSPGFGIDLFVAKYTSAGAMQWAKSIGSDGGETCSGVATDVGGNIYFTGYFNSASVDFDPGPDPLMLYSQGVQDMYLEKLDPSGQTVWAFSVGDYWSDSGYDVKVDDVGRVVVCGTYGDTVDLDPGPGVHQLIEQGQGDAFVGVYDANGLFLDGFGVGGVDSDAAWGLTLSGLNEVSITGYYYSATIDMDPGPAIGTLTNLGGFDAFLATYHYLSTGVQENASHGTMHIAPNPASDKFSLLVNDPDVQRVELLNAMGAEAPVTVVSRSGDRIELDASGCAPGIFLLRLITSNGAIAERVVLE